jgi:hypothetical protein
MDKVEYFTYLGSMMTNNEKCVHEIKSRITKTKAAFNRKKTFQQQIGF